LEPTGMTNNITILLAKDLGIVKGLVGCGFRHAT
jgi:hypothetical protein